MKKIVPVLLLVAVIALVFVTPVFALDGAPPVDAPVFDMGAISQALQTLIFAVILPLVGFAARWLNVNVEYKKSQLSEQAQWQLEAYLRTLVFAAEQLNITGVVIEKLDWVIERAQEYLFGKNLDIDIDELRARVEAIVVQEFNMHKILPEILPTPSDE